MTHHVAIWLDHEIAHVYAIAREGYQLITLKNPDPHHSAAGHHVERDFFRDIAVATGPAESVYLCGPGTAKVEFEHYAQAHDPGLARRIARVESADHPSNGELVATARAFFRAHDRMTS